MKLRKKPQPRTRSWPGSTFSLQIEVERDDWDHCRQIWVFLARQAPGRHGRLKLMHAIIPLRRKLDEADRLFASPSYRLNMIQAAAKTLVEAGVTDEQAQEFMAKIAKVYPPPTPEDIYLERLNDPLVTMALGERRKELSYFETGVPEWRESDLQLLKHCMDDLTKWCKTDKRLLAPFTRTIFGGSR
jgi:hypothetical protein